MEKVITMFEVGDRIEVKHGKFKGCVGTIIDIDYYSLPPITIRPDDIRKFQGVFFYECDLKKIEKTLDKHSEIRYNKGTKTERN